MKPRIGRNRTQGAPLSLKAKGKTSLYKTKCLLTPFRAIILLPKALQKGPLGAIPAKLTSQLVQ